MFGLYKEFIKEDLFYFLKNEINFKQDTIVVGNYSIKEERKTCWMSDFDYNYIYGKKIMTAKQMSPNVKYIQNIIQQNYGKYYDSVLINYYLDNGDTLSAYQTQKKQTDLNNKIIQDFKNEWSLCPVYFFLAQYSYIISLPLTHNFALSELEE